MKRLCKILFTLTLCLGVFVMASVNADAKNISGVRAVSSDGKIIVSGTAEEGTLACAVFVYDSTESTVLDMETCAVKEDSTFRYQMSKMYAKGDYVVKVADYDGGNYQTTTVKVTDKTEENIKDTTTNSTTTVKSPKTSEETPWYFMVAALLLLGVSPILLRLCQ